MSFQKAPCSTRNVPSPGFTLIELLIVIAIIAILALIAVPNFLEAQVRAKVSRAKADMRTIATALEAYRVDTNRDPPDYNSGIYPGAYAANESLTYAQLTTPVAYITSAPTDPFRQGDAPADKGSYYEYFGADAGAYYSTLANTEAWQAKSIHWFIYTFAPDRLNDRLPANMDAPSNYSYDPTNGTISVGDLGRSNAQPSVP